MTVALLDGKVWWYTARASGLVAWAIVTASIVWGLALATRIVPKRGATAWLLDVHTFLGTLSLVFVGVHIVALWADSDVYFGGRELFVPMASNWRPGAVAWGIVATYLLLAIQLTSWAMHRLPRRLWHAVHKSSFLLFVAATVHGFTAGADRSNLAVEWLAVSGSVLVACLVWFQLFARRRVTISSQPKLTHL